jgi:hypothetical protein
MRTKEDESSTGQVWAAEFHHIMACSCVAHVLKLMKCFFSNFKHFLGHGKPRITETADTESADTGA